MPRKQAAGGGPWQYIMTCEETESWRQGDREARQDLLVHLAERVMCDAADHGKSRFEIYDQDGELVADGKLNPGDIEELFGHYRSQMLLN